MGVKGLTSLLQRLAPQSINLQHISHYQGKTAAVDISCFLNRFIYGLDPHPARVQRGVYRLCTYLKINGINPIFVFDGSERIVEKQRETERRRLVKEKVEISFILEKERKSRLKGLRSSANLLKKVNLDTASSILGDLRLQSNDLNISDTLGLNDNLRNRRGFFGFDDLNSQEGELDDESIWHAPSLTDGEHRQLERILNDTEAAYHNALLQTHAHEHIEASDSFDFELYVQERLRDGHNQLNLQGESSFDMSDLDPTSTGFSPMSIEDIIQATDLEQSLPSDLENLDGSVDEARIRHEVHKALLKFVTLSEREFGGDNAGEIKKRYTKTQKELNILEQQLVQEIKEIASSNERVDRQDDINNQVALIDKSENTRSDSQEDKDPSVDTSEEEEDDDDDDQNLGIQAAMKKLLSEHRTLLVSLGRRTLSVSQPLSHSCQTLLRAMGEPVVIASNAEAESVCARLTTLGIADISISEDTDTAVFGDGILLRQVGVTGGKDIIEINPVIARQSLGLNWESFRDMCILCGTDFSGTIEGIGPLKAAALIKRYGSIESVMANVDNKPRTDFFYDQARRVFQRTPDVPDHADAYLPKEADQSLLQELMLKYGIDDEVMVKDVQREMKIRELATEEDIFGTPIETNSLGADPFKATAVGF
ncbi:Elongation of fatty acids protein 2 [Entomortierella beljakovae]|nr:Elongation of fatty acids protein 2 [Entomortierella beljakovae]